MKSAKLVFSLVLFCVAQFANAELDIDATVGIEYGYDDNVIVEELDIQSALGDNFIRYRLKADLEYSINDKHELTASVGLNERQFQDADNFDLRTLLTTAGYNYDFGDLTIGVDIRIADSELGGNSFLKLNQYSPFFSYFITREHFLRGAYTFIDKTLDNNPGRDADTDEVGLDYYYFINGLNRYLILSSKWREQDALDDLFDFTSYQYKVGFNQRVEVYTRTLKFGVSYRYRERDYDQLINPQIGDTRLDEQQLFEASASFEMIDDLEIYAVYRYQDNESNLPDFTFDENRYELGFSYEF